MANENITILNGEYVEELKINDHKTSVEVAIRDGRGHIISDYYAPRSVTQEKLVSGVNIATINGNSLNGPYNYELRTIEDSYSKSQIDNKLTSKLELLKVGSLPTRDINTTAIYMINSTKELYIYSNEWVKIGLSLPTTPVEAGTYALLCTVGSAGGVSYSWGEASSASSGGGNDQPDTPPVQERVLTRITINRTPTKTLYVIGEEFNSDGLSVIAYYTGILRGENVTESVTLSEPDMSIAGPQTITVSYTENDITVTEEFTITIELPTIVFDEEIPDGEFSQTFTFPEGLTGTDNEHPNTAYSSSNENYPVIDFIEDDETGNIITVNAGERVYLECPHGIKLGSSSAKGSINIDITDSEGQPATLNIQTIKIHTYKYGNDSVELKLTASVDGYIVPEQTTSINGGNVDGLLSTLPFGYPTSQLHIESSGKRIYIDYITITYNIE